MGVELDYRRIGKGTYLEIWEEGWRKEVFGLFNMRESGELDSDDIEKLEESAQDLDYDECSDSFFGKIRKRLYGGVIQTPHGTREWFGEIPEDVETYLEEIRDAGAGI